MDKNGRRPSNNEIAMLGAGYAARENDGDHHCRSKGRPARPAVSGRSSNAARITPVGHRARLDPRAGGRGAFVAFASEHTFERVSVAKDYELKTEALRHGRGRIELPEVKGEMLAPNGDGRHVNRARRSGHASNPAA